MTREELIAESRRRLGQGDTIEDVIRFLRSSGCWKTETIIVISKASGIGPAKAKELVHFSETWKDTRSSDEKLQEEMLEAIVKSGIAKKD